MQNSEKSDFVGNAVRRGFYQALGEFCGIALMVFIWYLMTGGGNFADWLAVPMTILGLTAARSAFILIFTALVVIFF